MGYDVRQAADAEEGMRVLAAGKIDVLLTDIVLPGQSGIELARAAVERYPGIGIVFASGRDAPTPAEIGFNCASLRKPFRIDQLHALIAALHRSAGAGRNE
jgi:DNA-binding response OmpR family regulator